MAININRILLISAIPVLIGGFGLTISGKAVAEQSALIAQNQPPSDGQRPDRGGPDGPFSRLGLSQDQKTKIQQIREDAHKQMDAVFTTEQKEQLRVAREQRQRPNLNLTDAQKAKMKAIHEDCKKKVDAVLTDQQKQQLQEMHQQRQQRRQQQQS